LLQAAMEECRSSFRAFWRLASSLLEERLAWRRKRETKEERSKQNKKEEKKGEKSNKDNIRRQ
jgi:hypothetical protein